MSKKKKYRGHFCWVCGSIRPNEKFSGKGHKNHICVKCAGKPKEELQSMRDKQFVYGLLEQKNISKKNIVELNKIAQKYMNELGRIAEIFIEIGRIHLRKKKRTGFLYNKHREIFNELVKLGIIEDYITPIIEEEERSENEQEEWVNSFEPREYKL